MMIEACSNIHTPKDQNNKSFQIKFYSIPIYFPILLGLLLSRWFFLTPVIWNTSYKRVCTTIPLRSTQLPPTLRSLMWTQLNPRKTSKLLLVLSLFPLSAAGSWCCWRACVERCRQGRLQSQWCPNRPVPSRTRRYLQRIVLRRWRQLGRFWLCFWRRRGYQFWWLCGFGWIGGGVPVVGGDEGVGGVAIIV